MADDDHSCADVTQDFWLGGKLALRQLRHGQRAGTDAALLAAAFAQLEGRIADAGAGAGAVGLALAQRHADVQVELIDINPGLVALAAQNGLDNHLSHRVFARCHDLLAADAMKALQGRYDVVVSNPPFYLPEQARAPRDRARAQAHVLYGGSTEAWVRACRKMLRPKGVLVMIHRPEALAAILAGLGQGGDGLRLLALQPREGAPTSRIILRWQQGSRAPLCLLAPLVLHQASGAFTPEADALHRGEATLALEP
ncbi:MAG: methyltransferase [Hyphomicrobiales bacterium]|nr:methyltransferase [Hyphomicrobiales bacterium]